MNKRPQRDLGYIQRVAFRAAVIRAHMVQDKLEPLTLACIASDETETPTRRAAAIQIMTDRPMEEILKEFYYERY